MTIMTNKAPVIFVDDSIDVFELVARPYEPSKGDRRFVDQDRAIEHANEMALLTGVRQQIRKDSAPHWLSGFWLVQAVGS